MSSTIERKDFWSNQPQARKSLSDIEGTNPSKIREQIEKSKDFAIKMLFASTKNIDPFSESSSNQSSEMLQTTNLIAQLDASVAEQYKFDEMLLAIKNQNFNATALQGREVHYDNSSKYFSGKSALIFHYLNDVGEDKENISHISTAISIISPEGRKVRGAKISSKDGEDYYEWDGKDDNGKQVEKGLYTIQLESVGYKRENGKEFPFPINSSATLSGEIASVEIKNGITTNIILKNGQKIERDAIVAINSKKESELPDVKADVQFIGKKVEIDLTKVKISQENTDIYYNNHIKNNTGAKIKLFDKHHKLVKVINYDKTLNVGAGSIRLSKEVKGIASGIYTVNLQVKDADDKLISLPEKQEITVSGINIENNNIISASDNREYPARNIRVAKDDVVISRPEIARAAAFNGKEVIFKDNLFTYVQGEKLEPSIIIEKEKEDSLFYQSCMYIYNQKNQLVKTVNVDYNIYGSMSEEGKNAVEKHVLERYNKNYQELSQQEKMEVDLEIEKFIISNPSYFQTSFMELATKRQIQIDYLWDGTSDIDGYVPNTGEVYSVEFEHRFVKASGEIFTNGTRDFAKSLGIVQGSVVEGDKIILTLNNGREIEADNVLHIKEFATISS